MKIIGRLTQRGLIPKYDGPFKVREKIKVVTYKLILPEQMKLQPYYKDKEDPNKKQATMCSLNGSETI